MNEKDRHNREKAHRAVTAAVELGIMPPAAMLDCLSCRRRAKHYHHHLGYEEEHWLDVIPLCVKCHMREHRGVWSSLLPSEELWFRGSELHRLSKAQRWILVRIRDGGVEMWIEWARDKEMATINSLHKRGLVDLVEFKTNPGRSLYALTKEGKRLAELVQDAEGILGE